MRHHKSHPETPSLIGGALFEIGDILASATHTKVKRLRQGGCLFAQLEFVRQEQQEDSRILQIQMRAINLALRNSIPWNREPDTVVELAKQRVSSTGNSWVAVWRSGPVFNSLEPTWDKAELNIGSISHGDLSWPIRISVWFYKQGHADTLLGVCETTVDKLLNACMGEDDDVEEVSEKDLILTRLNNEGKEVGLIRITKAVLLERLPEEPPPPPPPPASTPSLYGDTPNCAPKSMGSMTNGVSMSAHGMNDSFGSVAIDFSESFASSAPCEILLPPMIEDTPRMTRPRFKEYVDSGCEIDLCFAIDFTSSNGDPRIPGSLHYQTPDSLNDYEETITAIGDALASFNNTREYPVWGFGAKFNDIVRHIFQLGPSSTVSGDEGVLEAYKSVFRSDLVMSGPTVFLQVIQAAALRARKYHQSMEQCRRYCVLLIITDGMVDDVEETQRKLQVYRDLPLSVVIIGVGRADFRRMNILCNQPAKTSFVAFRQHQHDPSSMAKAALENLPHDIVEYMSTNLAL
jgi:hypothetical protein